MTASRSVVRRRRHEAIAYLRATRGLPFETRAAYAALVNLILASGGRLDDVARDVAVALGSTTRGWKICRTALLEHGLIAVEKSASGDVIVIGNKDIADKTSVHVLRGEADPDDARAPTTPDDRLAHHAGLINGDRPMSPNALSMPMIHALLDAGLVTRSRLKQRGILR